MYKGWGWDGMGKHRLSTHLPEGARIPHSDAAAHGLIHAQRLGLELRQRKGLQVLAAPDRHRGKWGVMCTRARVYGVNPKPLNPKNC